MVTHVPVLLRAIVALLERHSHLVRVVDATLGLGGYSEAVLAKWEQVRVLGIDRDMEALTCSRERLAVFSSRFACIHGNFRDLRLLLRGTEFAASDALLFDLGVSNLHLTEADRGFAFSLEGPLDMRMDQHDDGITAAHILNSWSYGEICRILREYGEEPHAAYFSRIVVQARERGMRFERTSDVVDLLRKELPAPMQRKMGGHPARRFFQALRIAVNDELQALREGLDSCTNLTAPGGIVVAVSYHSLEDRIVKWSFRDWEKDGRGTILTRKPILPDEAEIEENPKSRSAKLRAFRFAVPVS